MKRLTGLWDQVVAFDNLLLAYRKARRGKGRKAAVAGFALRLEHELLLLQRELLAGSYRPGAYRQFTIYERKPRLISAAPFRDRVVHHALLNVIEPPLDRRFIADSYACRAGKGTHAAVARYQRWANRYRYVLKLDIARYFLSIDHRILKAKLRARIKDRPVLDLLDLIIDSSPESTGPVFHFEGDDLLTPLERPTGIPIGNLTSQFFANLYLDDLDHFIKERLRVPGYLRYVDDSALLGDDKTRLHELKEIIADRLAAERLRLHPRKAQVVPVAVGLDLLGYRVYPHKCLLRNDNGHRFARKLRTFARGYAAGRLAWEDVNPAVQSWIGHASHAGTLGLRRCILGAITFSRGSGQEAAGACCGAARGTTNRGTFARRTATGTTPTTGTTMSDFVSPRTSGNAFHSVLLPFLLAQVRAPWPRVEGGSGECQGERLRNPGSTPPQCPAQSALLSNIQQTIVPLEFSHHAQGRPL